MGRNFKVLMLSTSDVEGGAARAGYRLHQGLQSLGVESQILVRTQLSDDPSVIGRKSKVKEQLAHLRTTLDNLPLQVYKGRDRQVFSLQWFPDVIGSDVSRFNPDIINLHWVNFGFVKIETLAKLNKPLVWTLHDMWAFTGGCHYTQECDRYTQSCGNCPQLQSDRSWDLSRWVWHRKAKAWENLNLTIVSPSRWLADCAKASSLFKNLPIQVIPNGIDTAKYRPINRATARDLLKLPQDKQLVLFGSMKATSDRRKGFHLLQPALQSLMQSEWREQLDLVVFGSSGYNNQNDLGVKVHYLGQLNDDISIALAYAAADVFVLPSIQDNLPNTIMEAIACGTPCVAFKIGGMPDMIEHQQNGYLAQAYESEDLAQGIAWVLENKERHQKLCDRARQKAEQEFTLKQQASRYLSLFHQLL
jgi:glycosyltransferase involved in cell wall biosynthesis